MLETLKFWKMSNLNNDEFILEDKLFSKFPEDKIVIQINGYSCFFEGAVTNRKDLEKKYELDNWSGFYKKIVQNNDIISELRGGFSGAYYNSQELYFFNDHMGNHAIYYWCQNGKIIISSRWNIIVEELRQHNIKYTFDEQAARYMISYGYMLDNTTFAKEIKRVLPGELIKIDLKTDRIFVKKYWELQNETTLMKESDAIDLIDFYFRQAIKREFDKDKENGYGFLTDLSGGLDSRMVTWVANDLGYKPQMNVSYCKEGYLDYKIAAQIADKLQNEFIFKTLDDFWWYQDYDEILQLNNGAALYSGISGGYRLLKNLQTNNFGIEHTGMIGDSVLAPFFNDKEVAFGRPFAGSHRFSNKIECDVPSKVLEKYNNMELFTFYTRGLLGAQSSYFIRQNFLETSSAFLDVDFISNVMKIPFEYRREHNIYFAWMKKRYPESMNFGWERWQGVKPGKENEWKKYIKYGKARMETIIYNICKLKTSRSMVPFEYFYEKNKEVASAVEDFFEEFIKKGTGIKELDVDLRKLFLVGNVMEKSQVITVCSIYNNYFR